MGLSWLFFIFLIQIINITIKIITKFFFILTLTLSFSSFSEWFLFWLNKCFVQNKNQTNRTENASTDSKLFTFSIENCAMCVRRWTVCRWLSLKTSHQRSSSNTWTMCSQQTHRNWFGCPAISRAFATPSAGHKSNEQSLPWLHRGYILEDFRL